MPEKSEIERLVAEELARPEVKKAIMAVQDKPSWRKRVSGMTKHPVFVTLLGFLLTSLVGAFVGETISERKLRDDQLRNALEAVRNFATTASELRIAQNGYQDVLARRATEEEINSVKVTYDTAFSNWSSGLYANALATREFFGFSYDNFAEQAINRSLHQHFRSYQSCLEFGYRLRLTSETPLTETVDIKACLEEEGVPGAHTTETWNERERMFQCSRQIFDTLNHFISRDLNCRTSTWNGGQTPSVVSKSYDAMMETCGEGNTKPFEPYTGSFDTFCTKEEPSFLQALFR